MTHFKSSVNPYSLCSHSHFCLLSCLHQTLNLISISFPRGPLLQGCHRREIQPTCFDFPLAAHITSEWWKRLKWRKRVFYHSKQTSDSLLPKCHLTAWPLTSSSPQPTTLLPALFLPSTLPFGCHPVNLCISDTEWFNYLFLLLFHFRKLSFSNCLQIKQHRKNVPTIGQTISVA